MVTGQTNCIYSCSSSSICIYSCSCIWCKLCCRSSSHYYLCWHWTSPLPALLPWRFSLVLQITTQSWKIVAQIAGQGVGGSVLSVGACQLARCNCLMHASLACALFEQPGCNIKNARAAHEQLLPRLLATTVATRVAAEGVGGVGPTVKKPRRVRGLAVCTGRAADTDMRVQATVFMVQPVALATPPYPSPLVRPLSFRGTR